MAEECNRRTGELRDGLPCDSPPAAPDIFLFHNFHNSNNFFTNWNYFTKTGCLVIHHQLLPASSLFHNFHNWNHFLHKFCSVLENETVYFYWVIFTRPIKFHCQNLMIRSYRGESCQLSSVFIWLTIKEAEVEGVRRIPPRNGGNSLRNSMQGWTLDNRTYPVGWNSYTWNPWSWKIFYQNGSLTHKSFLFHFTSLEKRFCVFTGRRYAWHGKLRRW